MIDTMQAHSLGVEPSHDFMHGLGTDPSATIKTERFYVTPLREPDDSGHYRFVETAEEFTRENFSVLTLLYYMLVNICKDTGRDHVSITVEGIACDTVSGGKTVSFQHFRRE